MLIWEFINSPRRIETPEEYELVFVYHYIEHIYNNAWHIKGRHHISVK